MVLGIDLVVGAGLVDWNAVHHIEVISVEDMAERSKSNRCFNVKSSAYYVYMQTKILAEFCICISVPLTPVFLEL